MATAMKTRTDRQELIRDLEQELYNSMVRIAQGDRTVRQDTITDLRNRIEFARLEEEVSSDAERFAQAAADARRLPEIHQEFRTIRKDIERGEQLRVRFEAALLAYLEHLQPIRMRHMALYKELSGIAKRGNLDEGFALLPQDFRSFHQDPRPVSAGGERFEKPSIYGPVRETVKRAWERVFPKETPPVRG